jgi:hypothetical protein
MSQRDLLRNYLKIENSLGKKTPLEQKSRATNSWKKVL